MESSQDPNNTDVGIATEMALMAMSATSTTLTCKVQYMNDIDPFRACTKFPEPTRPPLFTFNVNIPLIKQIAAVHRLLKAPHRVRNFIHNTFLSFLLLLMMMIINNNIKKHHYIRLIYTLRLRMMKKNPFLYSFIQKCLCNIYTDNLF